MYCALVTVVIWSCKSPEKKLWEFSFTPTKRKFNSYIPVIQPWPICIASRYSIHKCACLLDLLVGANLLKLEEGNPPGVYAVGRETESNPSQHTACLPKLSSNSGVQTVKRSPIWGGCLMTEHPRSCRFSYIRGTQSLYESCRCASRVASNVTIVHPSHHEGGRWKLLCFSTAIYANDLS